MLESPPLSQFVMVKGSTPTSKSHRPRLWPLGVPPHRLPIGAAPWAIQDSATGRLLGALTSENCPSFWWIDWDSGFKHKPVRPGKFSIPIHLTLKASCEMPHDGTWFLSSASHDVLAMKIPGLTCRTVCYCRPGAPRKYQKDPKRSPATPLCSICLEDSVSSLPHFSWSNYDYFPAGWRRSQHVSWSSSPQRTDDVPIKKQGIGVPLHSTLQCNSTSPVSVRLKETTRGHQTVKFPGLSNQCRAKPVRGLDP